MMRESLFRKEIYKPEENQLHEHALPKLESETPIVLLTPYSDISDVVLYVYKYKGFSQHYLVC